MRTGSVAGKGFSDTGRQPAHPSCWFGAGPKTVVCKRMRYRDLIRTWHNPAVIAL